MEKEDIAKFITSLPSDVKNYLKSVLIAGGLTLSKMEKQSLAQTGEDAYDGNKIQNQYIKNQLLADLKSGNVTKHTEQYKQHFYNVLEKADEFMKKMKPDEILQLLQEGGHDMNFLGNDRGGVINKIYDDKHKNFGKTREQIINEQTESRGDKSDNLPTELIVNNAFYVTNPFEVAKGRPEKREYALGCDRNINSSQKLEEMSEYVYIKTVTQIEKIIEFYIDKSKHMINYSDYDNLRSIKNLYFTNNLGTRYIFNIKQFYKTVDFNNYEVIKFVADKVLEQKAGSINNLR